LRLEDDVLKAVLANIVTVYTRHFNKLSNDIDGLRGELLEMSKARVFSNFKEELKESK